jgi:hypothetical protein
LKDTTGPIINLANNDPSTLLHEVGHSVDEILNGKLQHLRGSVPAATSSSARTTLVNEAVANRYGRQLKRLVNKAVPGQFGANAMSPAWVDAQKGNYKSDYILRNLANRIRSPDKQVTSPRQFTPFVDLAKKFPTEFMQGVEKRNPITSWELLGK